MGQDPPHLGPEEYLAVYGISYLFITVRITVLIAMSVHLGGFLCGLELQFHEEYSSLNEGPFCHMVPTWYGTLKEDPPPPPSPPPQKKRGVTVFQTIAI